MFQRYYRRHCLGADLCMVVAEGRIIRVVRHTPEFDFIVLLERDADGQPCVRIDGRLYRVNALIPREAVADLW